jgi:hypothetical protein
MTELRMLAKATDVITFFTYLMRWRGSERSRLYMPASESLNGGLGRGHRSDGSGPLSFPQSCLLQRVAYTVDRMAQSLGFRGTGKIGS